jgi:hypothetical protein
MTLEAAWPHTTLQLSVPARDLVRRGPYLLAATERGVEVYRDGTRLQTLAIEADRFAVGDDGATLAISAVIGPPSHSPMRRVDGPDPRPIRRVCALAPPFDQPVDLDRVAADGFAPDFDGNHWAVFEGDWVYLLERRGPRLEEVARHETFWPCRLERCRRGLWLETSSLGASHFEVLSLPTLAVLERGDLAKPKITFPPEQFCETARHPDLARPLFAVDAAGMPRTIERGVSFVHAINTRHRVLTQEGKVVALLDAPAMGLVAEQRRAVLWSKSADGVEVLLVDLALAEVYDRLQRVGASRAGARIQAGIALLWDDLGRVLEVPIP